MTYNLTIAKINIYTIYNVGEKSLLHLKYEVINTNKYAKSVWQISKDYEIRMIYSILTTDGLNISMVETFLRGLLVIVSIKEQFDYNYKLIRFFHS